MLLYIIKYLLPTIIIIQLIKKNTSFYKSKFQCDTLVMMIIVLKLLRIIVTDSLSYVVQLTLSFKKFQNIFMCQSCKHKLQ